MRGDRSSRSVEASGSRGLGDRRCFKPEEIRFRRGCNQPGKYCPYSRRDKNLKVMNMECGCLCQLECTDYNRLIPRRATCGTLYRELPRGKSAIVAVCSKMENVQQKNTMNMERGCLWQLVCTHNNCLIPRRATAVHCTESYRGNSRRL